MKKDNPSIPQVKGHGAGTCIRLGYRQFALSMGAIIKAMWPFAVVYALMCGLLVMVALGVVPTLYALTHIPQTDWHAVWAGNVMLAVWAAVALVVGGLAEVAAYGNTLATMDARSNGTALPRRFRFLVFSRRYVWRTLKAALFFVVAVAVAMVLTGGVAWAMTAGGAWQKAPVSGAVGLLLFIIICMLALLPLSYVLLRYAVTPEQLLFKQSARLYVVALRHYPALFAVCLFCMVTGAVAAYVLAQPAVILCLADAQASLGAVTRGDAYGMPSYYQALAFAVFALAGVVMLLLRVSMLFPLRHMQQSIDRTEEERRKYDEEVKETS